MRHDDRTDRGSILRPVLDKFGRRSFRFDEGPRKAGKAVARAAEHSAASPQDGAPHMSRVGEEEPRAGRHVETRQT